MRYHPNGQNGVVLDLPTDGFGFEVVKRQAVEPVYMNPEMYAAKTLGRSYDLVCQMHGFDFCKEITAVLDRQDKVRMLSIGCGRSALLPTIRQKFSPEVVELVGVDCMPQESWSRSPDITWIVGDANRLNIPDETFDFIESTYSVSSYFDAYDMIEYDVSPVDEIVRLLARNGLASVCPGFPRTVTEKWIRETHANRQREDEADIELGLAYLSRRIASHMNSGQVLIKWRSQNPYLDSRILPATRIQKTLN